MSEEKTIVFREGISDSQYAGECGEFRETMEKEEFDKRLADLEKLAKDNSGKAPVKGMVISAEWDYGTDPAFFEYVVVVDVPPDRDWLCPHCKVTDEDGAEAAGEGCSHCNDGWQNEPNGGGRYVTIHNGVPCLVVTRYIEILEGED